MRYTTLAALALLACCALPALGFNLSIIPPGRFKLVTTNKGPKSPKEKCALIAGAPPTRRSVKAGLSTVTWGSYWEGHDPALVVNSGDTVFVETFGAGIALIYEEQIAGDPAAEEYYAWSAAKAPAVSYKGAFGGGEGPHPQTGPVYVCGAEEGDVLQVDLLDLTPRINPKTKKHFGISFNFAGIGWWGRPKSIFGAKSGSRGGFKTKGLDNGRQGAFLWEAKLDKTGHALYYEPAYWFVPQELPAIPLACQQTSGMLPRTVEGMGGMWNNSKRVIGWTGSQPECKNGVQQWSGFGIGGVPYKSIPERYKDYSLKGKMRLPANLHIGNIGLANKIGSPVSTSYPTRTGGNMDDRRTTRGATLYFPIEVDGARLYMGDGHGYQGDGESSGTAIEMDINVLMKVTLHKKAKLPKLVAGLDYPLFENSQEYILHGFSFKDYLRELGTTPQQDVYGEATIDRAMNNVYNSTIDFLMKMYGLDEEKAVNMASFVDFQVTQLVDGNLGTHAIVPKYIFDPKIFNANGGLYYPTTMPLSSQPISEYFSPKPYAMMAARG